MRISSAITQLRTTDLDGSIDFYTIKLGLQLVFRYKDFYAGVRAGDTEFHLKLVDEKDPSIGHVDEGGHFHLYFKTDDAAAVAAELQEKGVPLVQSLHETLWGTLELVVNDDQGHTFYFGQSLD